MRSGSVVITGLGRSIAAGASALMGSAGAASASAGSAAEASASAGSAAKASASGSACAVGSSFADAASGFGCGWSPAPSSTATTVLTSTVSPSLNLISLRVPAAGEGISASTLSVEISNKGSSRSTCSPTFFSHLVIVPSAMDSPICGITTSVAMMTPVLRFRSQMFQDRLDAALMRQ